MMISEKPLLTAANKGISLPLGYQTVKNLGLVNLKPWQFISDKDFDFLLPGVNSRYPIREVIPFARRIDDDDVACFIVGDPQQSPGGIIIIHDFAGLGYEVVRRIPSFWDWFRQCINEMIEWNDPMGAGGSL